MFSTDPERADVHWQGHDRLRGSTPNDVSFFPSPGRSIVFQISIRQQPRIFSWLQMLVSGRRPAALLSRGWASFLAHLAVPGAQLAVP